jgi:hypothetical protein
MTFPSNQHLTRSSANLVVRGWWKDKTLGAFPRK